MIEAGTTGGVVGAAVVGLVVAGLAARVVGGAVVGVRLGVVGAAVVGLVVVGAGAPVVVAVAAGVPPASFWSVAVVPCGPHAVSTPAHSTAVTALTAIAVGVLLRTAITYPPVRSLSPRRHRFHPDRLHPPADRTRSAGRLRGAARPAPIGRFRTTGRWVVARAVLPQL